MTHIVFRCDASLTIGSGHVMRCRTLARELQRRGAEITFLCRKQPGDLIALLEKDFIVLGLPELPQSLISGQHNAPLKARALFNSWLGCSQAQDASDCLAMLELLSLGKVSWLVVDHYALDSTWHQLLRKGFQSHLMVIDDLANRNSDADLLLDQNLYNDMHVRYRGRAHPACRILIGPEFALLRPEFSQLRSKSLSRRSLPKLKRILITMGGSDPDNETAKAVEAVVMSKISWDHVDVVVGLGFRGHEKLSLAMAELNSCSLHVQTDQMAELMLQSDLAITSSGSITWEKCSLGLPSIVVESGENEAELARCGHVFGFLYNLGPSWSVTVEDYVNILVGLIPDRLTSMTRVAQCLCDGTGVNRVANTILNFHR